MSRAHGRECYAKLRARLERHRVHVESLFPMNLNCFATGNENDSVPAHRQRKDPVKASAVSLAPARPEPRLEPTSRYNQDTCRIHHDTSGYVSDRTPPPPQRIGNPPSPSKPQGQTQRRTGDAATRLRPQGGLRYGARQKGRPQLALGIARARAGTTVTQGKKRSEAKRGMTGRLCTEASRCHPG